MEIFLEKHVYQICNDYAKYQKNLEEYFLLSYYKAYPTTHNSTFKISIMTHDEFYSYLFYELENIFISHFSSVSIEDSFETKFQFDLCDLLFNHPRKYFDKNF